MIYKKYMKKALFLLTVVFATALFCSAQTPATTDLHKDTSKYRQLVNKIRSGDSSVNFGELRRAYVEWLNDGTGLKEAPNRDEMVKAFRSKDLAKATQLGEAVVEYEFVNPGLLGALADAYKKLGNESKSRFYSEVSEKAEHGLFLSGDGKTSKTAYFVMDVDEEYRVMRTFNFTVSMQSLLSENGQSYDLLSGKDENGKVVELYFNICAFFPCGKAR